MVRTKIEKWFSSPIGESIFSTEWKRLRTCSAYGSRPLSGNLFSLPNGNGCVHVLHMVLVPYRGIYFLYDNTSNGENKVLDKVLVPYRGIYFLYGIVHL